MKRVLVTLDKAPNYVFHLAALAGAGFRSPYADKYQDTVSPSDLGVLEKHKDRIAFNFGDGKGGDLSGALLFEPAALNLESTREFAEYFDNLNTALGSGNYAAFLERYRYAHPDPPDWNVSVDKKWLAALAPSRDVVKELSQVFVRSFDKYDRKVYPLEAVRMTAPALRLSERFKGWDCIAKWEEVTGFTWKYPDYQIVLCSALEGGPTANSLGYRKNAFYFGHDFEWMWRFVSHEVGTHIMMEVMMAESRLAKYDAYLVYRAYECLARFYNCKVLGEEDPYEMAPQHHWKDFHAIYSELSNAGPGTSPADLLGSGIERILALEVTL